MAISPERVRGVSAAPRSLSDIALDGLAEAVLLVDLRQAHKPIVLANGAARQCLGESDGSGGLLDSCLYDWLSPHETGAMEKTLASLSRLQATANRQVLWRTVGGEVAIATDFKRLEVSGSRLVLLRLSSAALRPDLLLAVEQLPMDLLVLDRQLKITYANASAVRTAQCSLDALLGSPALDVHPTAALSLEVLCAALAGEAYVGAPIEVPRPDGGLRCIELQVQPLQGAATVLGLVVTATDAIARPERSQTSLPSSTATEAPARPLTTEELFRLAADAIDGVIFEWDIPRDHMHRSHGLQSVLGEPGETLGVDPWRDRIHPPDLEVTRHKVASALHNERGWTTTYRIRDARNRYRWIFERALIQRDTNGEPLRAIGCSVDVTEFHRLADLLAETQRATNTGGWEYFYGTRELTWTDEMYRIHETTPMEFAVTIQAALERFSEDSRQRLETAFENAIAGEGHFDIEVEIITLKARRRWARMIGHIEWVDGRRFRLFGSLQAIQTQKLAQIALDRHTDWLKLSMRMAQLRAWRWDRVADRFEFAALKHGGSPVRSVRRGLAGVLARMHPDDRKSISRAIARSFRTRAEVREEFRLRAKDGSYRYYVTTVRPVFDDGSEASGLVGVTQDVTERKRMEREIIEVSGRERHRIGRDLHDGLGQELTGVALMLRGLARRVERDCPDAVPAANEIVALVNQSIETARSLARGLLPVSTEQGGLVAALRTLAERSRGLYGFEVRFSPDVWPQCTLEEALASHLYRIAQEAVTNAARHGHATVVEILLTFSGSRFLLKVTDNGCGMPQAAAAGPGVGLKIMAYRANLIGAKLEIGANAPHGTIVRVIGEQPSATTAV
jgi:signal transduction histidine kinase